MNLAERPHFYRAYGYEASLQGVVQDLLVEVEEEVFMRIDAHTHHPERALFHVFEESL